MKYSELSLNEKRKLAFTLLQDKDKESIFKPLQFKFADDFILFPDVDSKNKTQETNDSTFVSIPDLKLNENLFPEMNLENTSNDFFQKQLFKKLDRDEQDKKNGLIKVKNLRKNINIYVNRFNDVLKECKSVYRIYFKEPDVDHFNYSFSILYMKHMDREGKCGYGHSRDFVGKLPIGVFLIYNTLEISDIKQKFTQFQKIQYKDLKKHMKWIKSATDVFYNYKANVVDFAYGCTRSQYRKRYFSLLTRLPIILYLLEHNDHDIHAIVNHSFPFTTVKVKTDSVKHTFPSSQLLLSKKLNFMISDWDVSDLNLVSFPKYLDSPFLDKNIIQHKKCIETQNELLKTYMKTKYGTYIRKHFIYDSVSYNTFLMLDKKVTVNSLPLLKKTLSQLVQCHDKTLWKK